MVGDGKVRAGEVIDGDTSRADQVQDVSAVVSGEVDVLSEVEAFKYIKEFGGKFAVCGVNMDIEVS